MVQCKLKGAHAEMDAIKEPIVHYRDPVTDQLLCGRKDGLSLEPWPRGTIREVVIEDITCLKCRVMLPVATWEQMEEALLYSYRIYERLFRGNSRLTVHLVWA